jgi:hypothetical protein
MFGINTVVVCAICGGNIIVVGTYAICPTCMTYVDSNSGEPYVVDTSNEAVDEFDDIEDNPPIDEFYNR